MPSVPLTAGQTTGLIGVFVFSSNFWIVKGNSNTAHIFLHSCQPSYKKEHFEAKGYGDVNEKRRALNQFSPFVKPFTGGGCI